MPGSGILSSLLRLRSARDETFTLDTLLAHASPERRIEERLLFLVRLLRWVRSPVRIVDASTAPLTDAAAQHGRIRFLLQLLDRNEESKRAVCRTLRSIVRDTNALDLFSETGMPAQLDLFGELRERITQRLLPAALDIDDLAQLFDVLFPSRADALWIESIDTETALGVHALLLHDVRDDEGDWNSLSRGLDDALLYLASQIRASGMSKSIRDRLGAGSVRRLPFFGLAGAVDDLLASKSGAESLDKRRSAVLGRVHECDAAVRAARAHLVETGVSVPITYQLTRLAAQLARVRDLVEVATDDRGTRTAKFIARLVRQSHERRGVLSLLRQSGELWALKVVERSAQTGEHYITRSRREYRHMLGIAALGGLLTGLTTIVKVLIASLHWPTIYEGVAFALNYSVSFLLIQAVGGTLATKQPANTAPAIAARLEATDTEEGLEAFVDEIAHLIRSQVAGILGNVVFVVPATIGLYYALLALTHHNPVSFEKADATLHSLSIVGPSAGYAAFTGFLLFLGGFAGGAADNWVVFRRIKSVVGTSILFTIAFGRERARRIGSRVAKHFSGVVASVALGVLLGMTPAICSIFHLPLDVRHVTLSSGSIAAAVSTLGPSALVTWSFWSAVIGVFFIGVMNLTFSFAFAMRLALSARSVRGAQLGVILRAIFRRLRTKPWTFVLPIGLPLLIEVSASDRPSTSEL